MKKEIEYYDPNFGGTNQYHNTIYGIKTTDSVIHFMNDKEAFWTLDVIGSYRKKYMNLNFVVFTFDVDVKKSECLFKILDDDKVIAKQRIPFTDLDVSVKMFLDNGILMFPNDY